MRQCKLIFLMVLSTIFVLPMLGTTAVAAQSESATYVGSDRCLVCHSAGSLDKSGWQETVHANIYREPTTDVVIGDFNSAPVEFSVGDATLTVSFDDSGGSGPWSMRLQGATFDTTLSIVRAHGGYRVDDNEDAVLPDAPGRRYYIGKQRYHTKIGNSYYILPAQWNPFPDRDDKNQGWVAYHASDWMDSNGDFALVPKASEERRCVGCHQVGDGPTVNSDGEYVLAEADNPSFWNIGCEACHGPGSEHASAPSAATITNPADLTVQQQNEACGRCHIRPTGHGIEGGDASPGYPYSSTLGRTFRPGDNLDDFIAQDSGGYWPDGTSKQHHQQYADYQKSKHFTDANMSCISCHVAHNETTAEHDLTKTARDNSLCTDCHTALSDNAALESHTRHEVDVANGIGRCVDCHMPAVQKSGVNYDIHAHTFEPIKPQTTLDTQDEGGTPNSCAVSCHADGLLGAADLGVTGGTVGAWNEEADVSLAENLSNFFQWAGLIGPLENKAETVSVVQVSEMPVIDGKADDAAWRDARVTRLTGGVTLKAVHDGTDLAILATWPDPTMSLTRGGSWTWDGSAWSTAPSAGQSEDRLAILWNINASDFAQTGCGVKCHGDLNDTGGEDDAFMDSAGERLDMWHMKAARSLGAIDASQSAALTVDPVSHEVTAGSVTLDGYADDKYIGPYSSTNAPDGGRYGDAGGSTYGRNRNSDKSGPLYIEKAPDDYIDAMTLRQDEIDGGETLELATASAGDISSAWANYEALDAVLPERILRAPAGSRGDVRQSATWKAGVWTSEFKRALVTGTDDDLQFDDLSADYWFSVAVMDNAGGDRHQIENQLEKLRFTGPAPSVTIANQRATVVVTLTDNGTPVAGAEVAFARSVSGRVVDYAYKATTGTDGKATIDILVTDRRYWRTGATGYYQAKATNTVGAVIGQWSSIPINGGKEVAVSLPIGERASVETGAALKFALGEATPNPFNPSTQISYVLPNDGEVELTVYNALGQKVNVLVRSHQTAGQYRVVWDGKDHHGNAVASGVYLYRLVTQGHTATGRMMMLK